MDASGSADLRDVKIGRIKKVWPKARVPFVWEKVQITASSENEIAALLPVTLHHVTALVEPSLLDDLRSKVDGALRARNGAGEQELPQICTTRRAQRCRW